MQNLLNHWRAAGRGLLCAGALALPACSPPCTGNTEATVLYAKPRPGGGRFIYADVLNQPALGRKKTLLWQGKEFGTFGHVIIINDPTNKYASNRSICFTTSRPAPATAAADDELGEEDIPRLAID
ncbi:hypothetical protein [Hymenobacter coccineus]|uniref:Uncharacterized protein n=1 Tax=Hymenobacter coccineus TaxID=1908235 RepID=A0A1G1TKH5_9BACT|nr:hypothetical protein [Hymenobacter coccineus]OGX91383.1 hypothetical protein BEN49_20030 [Hymenobacter coccineus]